MKRLLLAVATVLLVAACAGTAPTRATVALGIACDSIATSLDQLAPLRSAGRLSAVEVAVVTRVRDTTAPACAKDSLLDPVAAVAMVETSAAQLRTIIAGRRP